ncbi:MAG: hypothetical protein BWY71_01192 [Planctomycetes bacterium ADurb.Bin412]|nr:MAG: hypothetical protein BWY71_01192 [Planctomycetes bacterium ADurb.Bin412]
MFVADRAGQIEIEGDKITRCGSGSGQIIDKHVPGNRTGVIIVEHLRGMVNLIGFGGIVPFYVDVGVRLDLEPVWYFNRLEHVGLGIEQGFAGAIDRLDLQHPAVADAGHVQGGGPGGPCMFKLDCGAIEVSGNTLGEGFHTGIEPEGKGV